MAPADLPSVRTCRPCLCSCSMTHFSSYWILSGIRISVDSVMRPMRRTCAQYQRAGSFDLVVALDTEMWNHRRSQIPLSIAVAGQGGVMMVSWLVSTWPTITGSGTAFLWARPSEIFLSRDRNPPLPIRATHAWERSERPLAEPSAASRHPRGPAQARQGSHPRLIGASGHVDV